MNDKRQLLCTFANLTNYKNTIKQLYNFYNIYNNCVFVFENENNKSDLYITYNIINENCDFAKFRNTILIHRKKQYNVLYSINALNVLVKDENGGNFDKDYKINWEYYKDSLIISGEISVKIIPIKLFLIQRI